MSQGIRIDYDETPPFGGALSFTNSPGGKNPIHHGNQQDAQHQIQRNADIQSPENLAENGEDLEGAQILIELQQMGGHKLRDFTQPTRNPLQKWRQ